MNYPIDVIDETEELTAEQLELVTQILAVAANDCNFQWKRKAPYFSFQKQKFKR